MDRVCVETMESSHTGLVECLNNWQRMQLYVLPFCVTTANACSGIPLTLDQVKYLSSQWETVG